MLSNYKLQKELYEEVVTRTFYVGNRSSLVAINCNISEGVWIGHWCDYSNFKIFGCDAYALISKYQRSKWDLRSNKYIFVDYGNVVKGYTYCGILLPTKSSLPKM